MDNPAPSRPQWELQREARGQSCPYTGVMYAQHSGLGKRQVSAMAGGTFSGRCTAAVQTAGHPLHQFSCGAALSTGNTCTSSALGALAPFWGLLEKGLLLLLLILFALLMKGSSILVQALLVYVREGVGRVEY